MLQVSEKNKLIADFKMHEKDSGSAEVQVALLTQNINNLQSHFKSHPKDANSRRGLIAMVNRRRKLLEYVKKYNEAGYKGLVERLGLRK